MGTAPLQIRCKQIPREEGLVRRISPPHTIPPIRPVEPIRPVFKCLKGSRRGVIQISQLLAASSVLGFSKVCSSHTRCGRCGCATARHGSLLRCSSVAANGSLRSLGPETGWTKQGPQTEESWACWAWTHCSNGTTWREDSCHPVN